MKMAEHTQMTSPRVGYRIALHASTPPGSEKFEILAIPIRATSDVRAITAAIAHPSTSVHHRTDVRYRTENIITPVAAKANPTFPIASITCFNLRDSVTEPAFGARFGSC